jgi:hypothetical protein
VSVKRVRKDDRRRHDRPGGVNGRNRSLVTFYTPHPLARPCRKCGSLTDSQDLAYTRALVGVGVCVPCLRAAEAILRRERHASHISHIAAVQAAVNADPSLLEPPSMLTEIADHKRANLAAYGQP